MNVLILSSNHGSSHNYVADAIQERYLERGDRCEIRDCLSFLSDNVSEAVDRSRKFWEHHSEFFDLNVHHRKHPSENIKVRRSIQQMIDLGKVSLARLIQDENFDVVICTHAFAAMMLTAASNRFSLHIRTAIVETEYSNAPGSANNNMDIHFIPDDWLSSSLISSGIQKERIIVSGIPVKKNITDKMEKQEAKRLLGLEPQHKHVLLNGCNMDDGEVEMLLNLLFIRLNNDAEISVVCASKENLRTRLMNQYHLQKNIHFWGPDPNISFLMNSADLLLTTPDSISITEAIAKTLPMVLSHSANTYESGNLQFCLERGTALSGGTAEELVQCCCDLLSDEESLASLSGNLLQLYQGDAAEKICETMDSVSIALCIRENEQSFVSVGERKVVPFVQSPLRHGILEVPKAIYEASGIVINGRRIKSLVFTTDLAIIRNCDADAVLAVYPFTPQQAISEAIIKAAYVPVFCGVGGGTTKGLRTIGLAKDAEAQGAMGVVLNAPITDLNLAAVAKAVDVPVIITVVNANTDIERRLVSGASIINVAGGKDTASIVQAIRNKYPDIPIIASGGKTDDSIRETIHAGANAITYTPPTTKELFRLTMENYRDA